MSIKKILFTIAEIVVVGIVAYFILKLVGIW